MLSPTIAKPTTEKSIQTLTPKFEPVAYGAWIIKSLDTPMRDGAGWEYPYKRLTGEGVFDFVGMRGEWFYAMDIVSSDYGYVHQSQVRLLEITPESTASALCKVFPDPTTMARGIIYPKGEKLYYILGEGEYKDTLAPGYGERWFDCAAAAEAEGFTRGHQQK